MGTRRWLRSSLFVLIVAISTSLGCGGDVFKNLLEGGIARIEISPANTTIHLGTSVQLRATVIYGNNTKKDITDEAFWETRNISASIFDTVTVSTPGMIKGEDIGTAVVTVTYDGVTGQTEITVDSAVLIEIQVTPTNPSRAKGTTQQFTATGIFSDNSTQDITASVNWLSDDTDVATVSTDGMGEAIDLGMATITASLDGVIGYTEFTVTEATLVSIAITPSSPSSAKGLTRQFTATGTYSDNSTQNITSMVTWSSDDTDVATIGNTSGSRGLASALDTGTSVITATLGAVSGNTNFTVTAATLVSIAVTPTDSSAAKGLSRQFTATGTYTDNSTQNITNQVVWSSDDEDVATISNALVTEGRASAVGTGTTVITAELGSVSGNTNFTVTAATLVSISVTPANPSTAKGLTLPFTATGTYTDNSTQNITTSVTWSSSNTSVSTISNADGSRGVASALNTGTTTITASLSSVSGNTTFTVTTATLVSIALTPPNPSIAKGLTQPFTATGTYTDNSTQNITTSITWSSSDTSVSTISNADGSRGLASANNTGTTVITAKDPSTSIEGNTNFTVTAATLSSISVTPANITLTVKRTQQYKATGTYSDNTTQDLTSSVTWSSSQTGVANISNADDGSRGIATTAATGTTEIKATLGSVYGITDLNVSTATLVSITVSPVNPRLATGMKLQFQATGVYSDNSIQDITEAVTWSSGTPGNATISNVSGEKGLATAVSAGTSTITATDPSTSISGDTLLTVTSATLIAVTVTPADPSIANGSARQFAALGTFDDSTTQDITTQVTWYSSQTGVAVISNASGTQGYATSTGAGTTTITALHAGSGKSGSTILTVTNATLVSITITPTNPICYGTTQQFKATGNYDDLSTQDITSSVTWSSSVPGVATISNASGSNGLATSVTVGSTIITADLGTISKNTILEVRAATLIELIISPEDPTVALPGALPFTVKGVYTGPFEQDLTTQVLWSSSNTGVAVISNAAGSQGLASSTGTGFAVIRAERDGVWAETSLEVEADTIDPVMSSATLIDSTKVRVTYSEAVNVTNASKATSYKITSSASGDCDDKSNWSGSTQTADFSISSVTVESPSSYILNLTSGMQNISYTVLADRDEIEDMANNALGCPNNKDFWGLDVTPPVVLSASSLDPTTVRVTFSENVNSSGAQNTNNYAIVNSPMSGVCGNNSNFSGAVKTPDFNISSVSGSGKVYDISLSAQQISGKSYTVLVNKEGIQDLAVTPNKLGCPNNADFTGKEQLRVSSAEGVTLKSFIVTFSKAVMTGIDTAGSAGCSNTTECAKRYFVTGTTSLGQITKATILDGSVCNSAPADPTSVCVEHTLNQSGGQYTIIVANNVDGDGFSNTSWGSIRDSGNTENVQLSTKDRASFTGTGTTPQNFADGAIADNPLGDDSAFGYLATYDNKIYIGPNAKGNSASRFNPDGTNPEILEFTMNKDTTGSGTSSNEAVSRDSGIAVPPYVTMGHTGCTSYSWSNRFVSANLATGCGPDDNDGRGLFTSGIINGTEHLFITGGRSAGYNYYMYWTTDTDKKLDYSYIDLYSSFRYTAGGLQVAGNRGTESITIFNNKIYWMSPGDRTYRPYLMKVFNKTAESANNTDSKFLMMTWMPGLGYLASSRPNKADMVGGTLFSFNNRLYIANSGSISDSGSCNTGTTYSAGVCEQTGGIVRSINNDPAHCTSAGTCNDWLDITPSTNDKYRRYFTNVLTKLADLIPADQPIPGFAKFNSKLYMIRNACTTSRWNRACIGAGCSDDTSCPAGEEVPQLWKCDPTNGGLDTTNPTTCESNEWSLVAENGTTGKTNFGDTNNTKITLLITNGSYLYVGFDNAVDGVKLYRTNVLNPSISSDFSQIGKDGLRINDGDPLVNTQLFSAISLQQGSVHYLYVSAGKSGVPVKVYRQQNL